MVIAAEIIDIASTFHTVLDSGLLQLRFHIGLELR